MPSSLPRFVDHAKSRTINRRLMEDMFFHRGDDEELYDELYKHRDEFITFWNESLDIELVVKENVAYRHHSNTPKNPFTGFINQDVPDAARRHFYWTGHRAKDKFLIFQRFLYWYEIELTKRTPTPHGDYKFSSYEFYEWVVEELEKFFDGHEKKPKTHEVWSAFKGVLRDMETFGFIVEVENEDIPEPELDERLEGYQDNKVHLYRARPALTAYDPYVLQEKPKPLLKAYGIEDSEEEE